MAPQERSLPTPTEKPRLGCWWRLWIVFEIIATMAMLGLATAQGAWGRLGAPLVLLLSAAYAIITLIIGLSISWIVKGRRS